MTVSCSEDVIFNVGFVHVIFQSPSHWFIYCEFAYVIMKHNDDVLDNSLLSLISCQIITSTNENHFQSETIVDILPQIILPQTAHLVRFVKKKFSASGIIYRHDKVQFRGSLRYFEFNVKKNDLISRCLVPV